MAESGEIPFDGGSNADPIKLAIPFIHCNMGGEMVYILEQRLYSQKIRKDKIERVLDDIIRQMYNPKVFKELLRPGPLPSNTYMRGIFHTIANTSIMKLSETSMEKMYELMVMGFKFQVISLTHPRDLIAITLNHVESNRLLTAPGSQARQVIDKALVQVETMMRRMTTAQYHTVRWLLCKFFQDRRTKVSLFLREGLQTERGYFPMQAGGAMPNDELVEMPGVVRYYEKGQPPKTEAFVHPISRLMTTQRKGDHFDYQSRDIRLGNNVYISQTEEQRKEAMQACGRPDRAALGLPPDTSAPAPAPPPAAPPPAPAPAPAAAPAAPPPAAEPEPSPGEPAGAEAAVPTGAAMSPAGMMARGRDAEAVNADANHLGAMLGVRGVEKPEEGGTGFKFNPFGEQSAGAKDGPGAGGGGEMVIEVQQMTRDQFQKINAELVSMMDELEVLDKVYNDAERRGSGSSLLDLLREEGLA